MSPHDAIAASRRGWIQFPVIQRYPRFMAHSIEVTEQLMRWVRGEREALQDLMPGSEPHFIAEHYWGYTARRGGTSQYRVDHPPWRWRELESLETEVDMGVLYGDAWADLTEATPSSRFLAEGSAISVEPCGRLEA